jgi:hypothetical protein
LARQTFDIYKRFDRNGKKLLDQLIIKCFPDVYIRYLEDVARNSKQDEDDAKKQALLLQVITMSKEKKTLDDQSKVLQKIQDKIRQDVEFHIEQKEYRAIIENLETNPGDEVPHAGDDPRKGSMFASFKKDEERELTQNQKQEKLQEQRLEFTAKLRLFKYYLACDFYEDNIGKVEIQQGDEIIEATFKMPSYVHLLP